MKWYNEQTGIHEMKQDIGLQRGAHLVYIVSIVSIHTQENRKPS